MSTNYYVTIGYNSPTKTVIPLKDVWFNQWKNLEDMDDYQINCSIPKQLDNLIKKELSWTETRFVNTYKNEDLSKIDTEISGDNKCIVKELSSLDNITPSNEGGTDVYYNIQRTYKGMYFVPSSLRELADKTLVELKKCVIEKSDMDRLMKTLDYLKLDNEEKQNVLDDLSSIEYRLEEAETKLDSLTQLIGLTNVVDVWDSECYIFVHNDWNIVDLEVEE